MFIAHQVFTTKIYDEFQLVMYDVPHINQAVCAIAHPKQGAGRKVKVIKGHVQIARATVSI